MTRAGVPTLESHLGYWLRFVSNHVSASFARKMAAEDVSVAEWVVMRVLFERGAIAPSRLADEIGMTRGGITKIANRLIGRKLLLRADSAEDGRAQTLALSAAGARLVPKLAALADENEREFFADLSERERRQLERTLRSIVKRRGLKSVPVE
ncbi:MAG TPA: MarR family transcriptional regulator [Xanthobacteraceae bacterium]|nr:MarR family transcriptional regulator [Xanthobacteraceae bacterium]